MVSHKTRPVFITGEIPDVERRIYNDLVVDVFEFGHGMVSQINSRTLNEHYGDIGGGRTIPPSSSVQISDTNWRINRRKIRLQKIDPLPCRDAPTNSIDLFGATQNHIDSISSFDKAAVFPNTQTNPVDLFGARPNHLARMIIPQLPKQLSHQHSFR